MPIRIRHAGLQYVKSFAKLFAIILITIQILQFYPFLSLLFLFIAYFMLPTTYDTSEPYKATEAWFRLLFGYMIAVFTWFILSNRPIDIISFLGFTFMPFIPLASTFSTPATSLFLLIMAFFVTVPVRTSSIAGIGTALPGLGNVGALSTSDSAKKLGNAIFIIFMLLGSIQVLTAVKDLDVLLILILIYIFSGFIGWTGGREGRPYIGVLVIIVSVVVLSFAYTSTFGTAVFGAWWPAVQGTVAPIITPIGQALGDSYTAAADSYLLLTCPTCYYEEQARKTKAESKIEGTPDAVEVVSFNTISSFIDWKIPFVGQLMIENKGEYSASNLNVVFDTPMISNPLAGTNEQTKEPFDEACLASDSFVITSCTDNDALSENKQTCHWSENFTKGDKKLIEFEINFKNKDDSCKQYAGNLTNINFKLKYDYQVDVKQDVSIMDPKYRQQKLLNNELQLKTIISEYVGGPLKAAISTLPQPLDASKKFSIFASITKGTDPTTSISGINYKVQILTPPGERMESGCTTSSAGCKVPPSSELYGNLCIMNCNLADADFGEKTNIAQKVLVAQYYIGTDAKEKTFTIVGHAEYEVEEDSPHDIPFAFVSEE